MILGGKDWSYFFNENTFYGTDDTSKNRFFLVDDGLSIGNIELTEKFSTMDELISKINVQLFGQNIQAHAVKVSDSQFKIEALNSDVTLSVGGKDVNEFFQFD